MNMFLNESVLKMVGYLKSPISLLCQSPLKGEDGYEEVVSVITEISLNIVGEKFSLYINLWLVCVILGIIIVCLSIFFLNNQNETERILTVQDIDSWKPDNIPRDRKYDFFYLKLGYQSALRFAGIKREKNLYSSTWGWATLDGSDKWRLNQAADKAQKNGQLALIGYSHRYKDPIREIRNPDKSACSNPILIAVIYRNDGYVHNN